MEGIIFITATEMAEILGISKPYAYKIIKQLNEELEAKGFIKQITDNKYILYETIQEESKTWWDEAPKTDKGAVIVPMRKKSKKEPVNYLDCANWDEN